jgi:chaperone BCS1
MNSTLSPHPFHADTDADSEEILQDADEDAQGELAPGKQTMRVVFQPTFGGSHAVTI